MKKEELKKILKERLINDSQSPVFKDEEGWLYVEEYVDYSDYLDSFQSRELFKGFMMVKDDYVSSSEDTILNGFLNYLNDETYLNSSVYDYFDREYLEELEGEFSNEVLEDVLEEIYIDFSFEEILKNSFVYTNLTLSTEEERNTDYTIITDGDVEDLEDTGIGFLLRKKGLNVELLSESSEDLKEKLERDDFELIEDIREELYNIINVCSELTIMLKMSIYDFLLLYDKIYNNKDKKENVEILKIEYAEAGIVDFYTGGGSILGIYIKDLILNTSDLNFINVEIDGLYNYGINEIYGGVVGLYNNSNYEIL